MEPNATNKPKPNGKALLPILVFLVLYLGIGIFFEYIHPIDGQMGFYIMSVVLAFTIAWITAMAQDRKRTFDEKIHLCAKGIGDDNITIMIFIFLFAGMFGHGPRPGRRLPRGERRTQCPLLCGHRPRRRHVR